jgi:enediyne polyketide synthase
MPPNLCLGDPAARDAAIHAIQACIPHARLLPVGVERIHSGFLQATQPHRVRASERAQQGNEYLYDLRIEDASGRLVEAWEGLRLRRMEPIAHSQPWRADLFGPYVERRLHELAGNGKTRLALLRDGDLATDDRTNDRTQAALQRAVGGPVQVWRRGDGKPQGASLGQVNNSATHIDTVSASHAQGFTLAMSGAGRLGCDLQEVRQREGMEWQDLLGSGRLQLAQQLATQSKRDLDTAATQVWCAMECLKKAGMASDTPLTLGVSAADGWTTLHTGTTAIATCIANLEDAPQPMALALLTESCDASV